METLTAFAEWLDRHESMLSALTAITAIIGVVIGLLAFVFPRFGRLLRSRYEALDATLGDRLPDLPRDKRPSGLPAVGKSALAVLPFRTLSSNENDIHLAAGIAAEIIADLARVPDLRVASHIASFAFQGAEVDLRQVAEVLSVRYVVTGSLQHAGNRIQVITELTDVADGTQMWADTYQRELEDIFEVQAEIAEAVAGAIGGQVKLADTIKATQWPVERLDAWGLVQKAFHFWLTSFSPKGFAEAMQLLRKAVEIDPGYAGAHASLAMILSQRSINAMTPHPEKDANEALQLIERAISLDSNELTVLENAGLVWTHHGHGKRATAALRQAVKLAPLDLMAWGYLGFNLATTGSKPDAEEAIRILDKNMSIAPKHPSRAYWCYFKSLACTRIGGLDEAEAAANEALLLQPGFYMSAYSLANIYGLLGKHQPAREAFATATAVNPAMTPQFYAHVVRDISGDAGSGAFLDGLAGAGILADPVNEPAPVRHSH